MFAYFAAISPNQQVSMIFPACVRGAVFIAMAGVRRFKADGFSPVHISYSAQEQISAVYSVFNIPTLVILGRVLFLAMVVVVKIANWSMGALRT